MSNVIDECVPNSHKYKSEQKTTEEPRTVEPVAHGPVKKKQKNEVEKFKSKYLSEDSDSLIGRFLNDMVKPAAKKMASDVLEDVIDYMKDSFDKALFGESRSHSRSSSSSLARTSYGKFYKGDKSDRGNVVVKGKTGFDFDPILFTKRGDAEAVFDEMKRLIAAYKLVSVRDMYKAANMDDCPFTYDRYGWTDVSMATIKPTYYENNRYYFIDLPRPCPFD